MYALSVTLYLYLEKIFHRYLGFPIPQLTRRSICEKGLCRSSFQEHSWRGNDCRRYPQSRGRGISPRSPIKMKEDTTVNSERSMHILWGWARFIIDHALLLAPF